MAAFCLEGYLRHGERLRPGRRPAVAELHGRSAAAGEHLETKNSKFQSDDLGKIGNKLDKFYGL